MYAREETALQGRLLYVIWMLLAAVLGLSGCAAPPRSNPWTGTVVNNQSAADIENARFTLADNSIGTLRSLDENYILKFEKFSQTIQLGKAKKMNLEKVVQINNSTILVINSFQENSCIKTLLLSVRGNEVQNWHAMSSDCKTEPRIEFNSTKVILNYPGSQFIYEDKLGLKEVIYAPIEVQQKIERKKLVKSNNFERNVSGAKEIKQVKKQKEIKNKNPIKEEKIEKKINDFGSTTEMDRPIVIDLQKK